MSCLSTQQKELFLKKYEYELKDVELISSQISNEKYDISICIPTFERVDRLINVLQDIVNQKDVTPSYEVVITDNTQDNPEHYNVINNFLKTVDFDYRYYRNSSNYQSICNWNQCISLSKGKFFILVHDDDLLNCYFLKNYQEIINSKFDYIAVKSIRILENKENIDNFYNINYCFSNFSNYSLKQNTKNRICSILGFLIRKDVINKIGLFPTYDDKDELSFIEDQYFVDNLLYNCQGFISKFSGYGYVLSADSASIKKSEKWSQAYVDAYFLRYNEIIYLYKGIIRKIKLLNLKILKYYRLKKEEKIKLEYGIKLDKKNISRTIKISLFSKLIYPFIYLISKFIKRGD